MASIRKHGRGWRVQIKIGGERRSQVFATKAEASQWALAETAAGKRGPVSTRLVKDALRKLHDELVNDSKSRSDIGRSLRLQDDPLASMRLADVDATALEAFRDRRLATRATPPAWPFCSRCTGNLTAHGKTVRTECRLHWPSGAAAPRRQPLFDCSPVLGANDDVLAELRRSSGGQRSEARAIAADGRALIYFSGQSSFPGGVLASTGVVRWLGACRGGGFPR